jgi:protease PrsW
MQVLLLSLSPVFIILFYIYFRDKYEKEPLGMLILSLIAGAIAVIPVMFIGQFLEFIKPSLGSTANAFYTSFIEAGLVEEGCKLLALYLLMWRDPNLNERFDGIVYAVFVSLGFAGVENILYVADGGAKIALIRAVTAVPAHALFGIRMGYYFGVARFYKEWRKPFLIRAFIYPVILHGIYDFMLLSQIYLLLFAFVPYLVWMFFAGFREMRMVSEASEFRNVDGEKIEEDIRD